MGSGTLEVDGSKLWELVVGEVLLCLQCREGDTCGEEVCVCGVWQDVWGEVCVCTCVVYMGGGQR